MQSRDKVACRLVRLALELRGQQAVEVELLPHLLRPLQETKLQRRLGLRVGPGLGVKGVEQGY